MIRIYSKAYQKDAYRGLSKSMGRNSLVMFPTIFKARRHSFELEAQMPPSDFTMHSERLQ